MATPGISINIRQTVVLSEAELSAVPGVSYYAHGSEWESITLTYQWNPESGAWDYVASYGSMWRLTAKGVRVKNSLTSGPVFGVPRHIREANAPKQTVTVIIADQEVQ